MCVLLHLLICTVLRAHIIVVEALYKINCYYYYIVMGLWPKQLNHGIRILSVLLADAGLSGSVIFHLSSFLCRCLKKGSCPKIAHVLCCPIKTSVHFNLRCVWVFFHNVRNPLYFRFFIRCLRKTLTHL